MQNSTSKFTIQFPSPQQFSTIAKRTRKANLTRKAITGFWWSQSFQNLEAKEMVQAFKKALKKYFLNSMVKSLI